MSTRLDGPATGDQTLPAITVRQPYAWAITAGAKTVENRTGYGRWRRLIGQELVIHAAQAWHRHGSHDPAIHTVWTQLHPDQPVSTARDALPTGVLSALVTVTDVHVAAQCCEPWGKTPEGNDITAPGRQAVHLLLANPRPLPPVAVRGQLGIWQLPQTLIRTASPASPPE